MIEQKRQLLGTEVKIVVSSEGLVAEEGVRKAFVECERIEREYSRFIDGNQLFELNSRKGEWVKVSEELYCLLRCGEEVKILSGGAFDITVNSVLIGWGYDKNYSLREQGKGALGSVELGDNLRVRLSADIDLGGLGKGYALDRMVDCLSGLENFCINAGGDIFVRGRDPGGNLWKILFEHPLDKSTAIGVVETDKMVLASSSANRRAWRNRHHIVNPLSLESADEMLAVYVQANSGILADAYATALFAMGYDKARAALENLPVAAMLIGPDGAISRSTGFKGELFIME